MTGRYCKYLRKSRKDLEAEAHGEGETLARHDRILDDLAEKLSITVSETYREIVSGESIASRPEMLRLLDDIENGKWDGVLVVEVERLARGDTRDQGLLMETFQYNHVKILTPFKTYDPNNEFDAEYFEFGLFMSRREYKTIKRRLAGGKEEASKEGKFAGSRIPYGYEKYKLPDQKGYSLRPIPNQAQIVKMIYDLYTGKTEKSMGVTKISRLLNEMQIPPARALQWTPGVVRGILTNCVYTGMIRWGRRKTVKLIRNGVVTNSHPVQADYLISQGLHEAIVDKETYEYAQEIFKRRTKRPPFLETGLKNPLAGILYCGRCKHCMIRRTAGRKDKHDWILCGTAGCKTSGASFDLVEACIIDALSKWFQDYRITQPATSTPTASGMTAVSLDYKKAELSDLEMQLEKVHTLLETGIYSPELFNIRREIIQKKIDHTLLEIEKLNSLTTEFSKSGVQSTDVILPFDQLFSHYWELSAPDRNCLLKECVEKIEYYKDSRGTKNNTPDFSLKIFPRLPRIYPSPCADRGGTIN